MLNQRRGRLDHPFIQVAERVVNRRLEPKLLDHLMAFEELALVEKREAFSETRIGFQRESFLKNSKPYSPVAWPSDQRIWNA